MAPSYFVAKVYRHANSAECVIPQAVCIALGIRHGDHVVFQWNGYGDTFGFKKFVPVGAKDGGDREHTDHEDRGGTTPAEVGARR